MVRVGIICADYVEVEPFFSFIQNCKVSQKAMLKFYEGAINNVDIVALFCGVCKTNAAIAAQIIIDFYNVDFIINSGTAGGMNESLDIFDIVVATEVAYHDVHKDILIEFHPFMQSIYFQSDTTLLHLSRIVARRLESKSRIYFGRMVTGEKFITKDSRHEINSIFQPLSVDMETASIAHVCYVNQIPFIAIRCITDTAENSGKVNFVKNCGIASEKSKDMVLELLVEINSCLYIQSQQGHIPDSN